MKNLYLRSFLFSLLFVITSACFAQNKKVYSFTYEETALVKWAGNFGVFTVASTNLKDEEPKRFGLVLVYVNPKTNKTERSYSIGDYEIDDLLKALQSIGVAQRNATAQNFEAHFELTSAEGCKIMAKKDSHALGFKFAVRLRTNIIPVSFKELGDIRNLIKQASDKLKSVSGN